MSWRNVEFGTWKISLNSWPSFLFKSCWKIEAAHSPGGGKQIQAGSRYGRFSSQFTTVLCKYSINLPCQRLLACRCLCSCVCTLAIQEHDLTDSKVLFPALQPRLMNRSLPLGSIDVNRSNAHMSISDTRICYGCIRHVAAKIPCTLRESAGGRLRPSTLKNA